MTPSRKRHAARPRAWMTPSRPLVVLVVLAAAACTRKREMPPQAAGTAGTTLPLTTAVTTVMTASVPGAGGAPLAFPGAEGFGARARGGRGGRACKVTTLAKSGPGSLAACLDAEGPRTVIFEVSGVIEGPLEIRHGRLTIAGQTSPRGIVVKGGLVCDNVYDPNDCNDVIVRHLRLRVGAPDSLRIGGAHDVVVDHCSMSAADDENVEITRSRNVTIQRSIIAEPRGEHYKWGGVLVNYSKDVMPLDGITIHHTVWNGVAGRLPELSCEENGDGPGKSNCTGRALSIELSNNVLWDVSDPIWFNRCTGTNQGNDCAPTAPGFGVRLNLVGNVMARRGGTDPELPFAEPALADTPRNAVHARDNVALRGGAPASGRPPSGNVPERHPFPTVTYEPASGLVASLARTAGAFPRDPMDERLSGYLTRPVDARPPAWRGDRGVEPSDALAPAAKVGRALEPDADGDGLPDAWERAHGLDPARADDGASVGVARGCPAGYTALECWLDELATAITPR